MAGELEHRYYGKHVQRATSNALDEIAARQLVVERVIKAKSQLAEYATSEITFLKALEKIAQLKNLEASDAIAVIIDTSVASIARSVGEFNSRL